MMDLSQKDYDLLSGIYHFGGYCNSYIATLATGTSRRNTQLRLKSLVERLYLRNLRIDFRQTTPHVFQVTAKTYGLFHHHGTYLSKNHPGDYECLLGLDHRKIRFYVVVANDWRKAKYLRVLKRGFIFPVERPDDPKTESYEEFVSRVTGTRTRPNSHLSLREIHLRLIQTKTNVFSNSLQR